MCVELLELYTSIITRSFLFRQIMLQLQKAPEQLSPASWRKKGSKPD